MLSVAKVSVIIVGIIITSVIMPNVVAQKKNNFVCNCPRLFKKVDILSNFLNVLSKTEHFLNHTNCYPCIY